MQIFAIFVALLTSFITNDNAISTDYLVKLLSLAQVFK